MNNLYQQLHSSKDLPPQNQKLSYKTAPQQNLKSLLNSSNPSELIQNMIKSNPKMQSVMQLLNTSGMSPKQFFYQYAQQNGVNPDQFINSLMS